MPTLWCLRTAKPQPGRPQVGLGRVVKATAKKGEEVLKKLIDSDEGRTLRHKLETNRALFTELLQSGGMDLLGSTTQIVPILTRTPDTTMKMTEKLLDKGLFLQGVRPPTVPPGLCRLRATVMATHAEAELTDAVTKILAVYGEYAE